MKLIGMKKQRVYRLAAVMAIAMVLASGCDRGDSASANNARAATGGASNTSSTARGESSSSEAAEHPSTKQTKPIVSAIPANPTAITAEMTPREMYVAYCGACHTLDLVESQRLDQDGWAWVMEDMVEQYGGTWIKPSEQKVLIDYLAETFGPK